MDRLLEVAKMAGIFKKSDEERAEELAQKEAVRNQQEADKKHQAWLQTPIGMATTAKEAGNGFFHGNGHGLGGNGQGCEQGGE